MRKVFRKSNLGKCILVLILFVSVFVFAGDVVVKEGVIEGVKFKSTGCTATGTKAVAFGNCTEASGNCSTAMGDWTAAIGYNCTAMGCDTIASGDHSTAMGDYATASGYASTAIGTETTASGYSSMAIGVTTTASVGYTTAIGKFSNNDVANSFTVGYGTYQNPAVDFRVRSELVNVYGDLDVDDDLNVKGTYKANGTSGWSGWFDDGANFRVTVTNGIITAVTDSVSGGHNP